MKGDETVAANNNSSDHHCNLLSYSETALANQPHTLCLGETVSLRKICEHGEACTHAFSNARIQGARHASTRTKTLGKDRIHRGRERERDTEKER